MEQRTGFVLTIPFLVLWANAALYGAPALSIVWPSNNAVYTAPAAITFGAAVHDPGHQPVKVQFFHGAVQIAEIPSPPFHFTWTGVAQGTHTVTAKASNAAGLTATAVVRVIVQPPPDIVTPIANAGSGLCMAIDGGSTAEGAPAVQRPCDGSPRQRFRLVPVDGHSDVYSIRAEHSGQCLSVHASLADSAPLVQSVCAPAPGQRFHASRQTDGSYSLASLHSGKALRARNGSTAPGAAIVQFAWNAVISQKWRIAGLR